MMFRLYGVEFKNEEVDERVKRFVEQNEKKARYGLIQRALKTETKVPLNRLKLMVVGKKFLQDL